MRVALRPLAVALVALIAGTVFVGTQDAQAGRRRTPGLVKNIQPANGSTITTCSFLVSIELSPDAKAGTLSATLNGVPLALTSMSSVFTATVEPGPPLQDENTLEISVQSNGGAQFTTASTFLYLPPKARAREITDAADCIQGPLAHCTVGDFLLENREVRYVIQKGQQRDLHSIGQYGGNLIDAELVADGVGAGNDNFFEFQPTINIETVINAQDVHVLNDGQDCSAAVVRACGPDDLIDFVNPSSTVVDLGFQFPSSADDNDQDVEGCTEYRLQPLERAVEVVTEVFNNTADTVGYYVGDYLNGAGELEQWTTAQNQGAQLVRGFAGVGEVFVTTEGPTSQSYFAFGDADPVDYAYAPVEFPSPFPTTSFTTVGVTVSLHSHFLPAVLALRFPPTFTVLGGGSKSFTRLFAVGDGDPSNLMELVVEAQGLSAGTLQGCVTLGGAPAPGVRVAVGPITTPVPPTTSPIKPLTTLFVTDASGCYSGLVPVGSYGAAAGRQGAPYEGGGTVPMVHPVTISLGATTLQDFALPATGRLRVHVVDESGQPTPARVSVVGFDPSPDPLIVRSALGANDITSGLFDDITKDGRNFGLVQNAYAGASGVVEFDVEPGSYQLYVSRGPEYSLFSTPVTISAAPAPPTLVNAQIVKVVDTTGFFSSDYHVHMLNSPDSRVSFERRVLSMAGEGVDNIIATDHDAVTDLNPTIAALGLTDFVHSTAGEEITTFDYGHFNAYPQGPDPSVVQSKGSTDWAGAAPPGQDFPSLGNFVLTPAQIDAAALTDPSNAGLETVVQINHITGGMGGHFDRLVIDTSATPPQSFAVGSRFRLPPAPNYFHPFKALELWQGQTTGAQNTFLNQRIGIWMNLLNQGILSTAISDTDTHTYVDLDSAGARTWTPAINGSDSPSSIQDVDVGLAIKAGKAVGGQGPYLQTRLFAASTGQQADFEAGTPTLVRTTDSMVDLIIDVQAPTWAPYDTIEIYANASTTVTGTSPPSGGTPVLFKANPTQVLTLGGGGFTRTTVPVALGESRFETSKTVTLTLGQDTWVVVLVKGTLNNSPPMFPVFPKDLSPAQNPTLADLTTNTVSENGVRALAVTNALFVDTDGNGQFDPPGVQVVP